MSPSAKTHVAPADPWIGRTVLGQSGGRFRIDRLIGRGGIGLVYLAQQLEPSRAVVIKVLAPQWEQDPEALARFEREAKRLAGLRHPNIVEMYDFGRDDGRSYLVMEYLEGELLSEYVARKKRLSLEEFVPIAAQILKGIGQAHTRETMLRDIKPANIMLCERKGRANFVKLLDFGLAKLLRGDKSITEEHVLGTVGYLAPEAIKGQATDLRVDVYAIGVLFYSMLAGRLPFEEETNEATFYKTIHEPPPDLRELLGEGHGLPEGLVQLIESCLAKNPDDRPSDADAIVERLIDVVPASLFRLPRAPGRGRPTSRLDPGAGNTGMIELVDTRALESGITPASGSLRTVEGGGPDTGPTTTMADARRPVPLIALSVATGALLAIVVIGVLLMAMGDDEPPVATEPVRAEARSLADVSAELDAIEAKIVAGELDDAEGALDRLRDAAGADPTLRTRADRLDRRLLVERLVASAEKLEQSGEIAAAIGAYRDAIEADPTHERSRKALSRLSAKAAGDTSVDAAAYGRIEISSRPSSTLHIDGTVIGPTPFEGKLPVGRHEVRMTARGHETWTGTVEVAADGNLPISVQLKATGRGERTRGKASPPTTATRPASATDSGGDASPADKPQRKSEDTFLPTKKPGSGDDPFLPTAKTP